MTLNQMQSPYMEYMCWGAFIKVNIFMNVFLASDLDNLLFLLVS
jgi:hypothetical protein